MSAWLRARIRREPLWLQAAVQMLVALAGHFGLRLTADEQTWLQLAALALGAAITRRHVTPTPSPASLAIPIPARGGPASAQPQKETTMNVQDFEAKAKAAAEKGLQIFEDLWKAHPELQSPAVDAAKAFVGDLASVADTEVEKAAPADLKGLIEAGVAQIQAKADADIANLKTAGAALATVTAPAA